MAQTSVEWLIEQLSSKHIGFEMYVNANKETIEQAKTMHKADCIKFAEQWESRCNEKNMDSKEQLYNETYKNK